MTCPVQKFSVTEHTNVPPSGMVVGVGVGIDWVGGNIGFVKGGVGVGGGGGIMGIFVGTFPPV